MAGPPALITPTFVKAFSSVDQLVSVTLGPNAGDVVIEAVASLPGFPSVTFGDHRHRRDSGEFRSEG